MRTQQLKLDREPGPRERVESAVESRVIPGIQPAGMAAMGPVTQGIATELDHAWIRRTLKNFRRPVFKSQYQAILADCRFFFGSFTIA
jgi:hypothetical protein